MRQFVGRLAVGAAMFAAVPLLAQQPVGGPPGGAPGMGGGAGGATMLLAHTGDLQLTDAQVLKLAAIARREGAQRTSMRNMMDSLRGSRTPMMRRDSAGARGMTPPSQLVAAMTRARDQRHADLRDAITVLTPDQQAQAWEMVASRGMRGRGGMGRRGGMGGMRGGFRREMMQGRGAQGGRMQGPPPGAPAASGQMRRRPPQPTPPPATETEPAN